MCDPKIEVEWRMDIGKGKRTGSEGHGCEREDTKKKKAGKGVGGGLEEYENKKKKIAKGALSRATCVRELRA